MSKVQLLIAARLQGGGRVPIYFPSADWQRVKAAADRQETSVVAYIKKTVMASIEIQELYGDD